LINFVDATNDANHYTKPPPKGGNCDLSHQSFWALITRPTVHWTHIQHSATSAKPQCTHTPNFSAIRQSEADLYIDCFPGKIYTPYTILELR